MLRSLAAVLAASTAAAAAPPACQTSSGIPCFTLQYEHSVWALVKSPVRDFVSVDIKGTMAVRADGSIVHVFEPVDRFAVRDRRTDAGRSDFRTPGLFWQGGSYRRAKDGDAICKSTAAALGANPVMTGKASFAGEPVVNWKLAGKYGETSVAIAAGLDCQVLRYEAAEYRYKYFPVRKELFEAKSVRRGEPAAMKGK